LETQQLSHSFDSDEIQLPVRVTPELDAMQEWNASIDPQPDSLPDTHLFQRDVVAKP